MKPGGGGALAGCCRGGALHSRARRVHRRRGRRVGRRISRRGTSAVHRQRTTSPRGHRPRIAGVADHDHRVCPGRPPSLSGVITALSGRRLHISPASGASCTRPVIGGLRVEDNRQRGQAAVTAVQRIILDTACPTARRSLTKHRPLRYRLSYERVAAAAVHRSAIVQCGQTDSAGINGPTESLI